MVGANGDIMRATIQLYDWRTLSVLLKKASLTKKVVLKQSNLAQISGANQTEGALRAWPLID